MHLCMQEISGFQGKNMQGKRRVTIFCLIQNQFCKACDIDHLQIFFVKKKVNFYGPKGKLTSQKINSLFGAFFSLHSSYAAANLRNKKTNVVPVHVGALSLSSCPSGRPPSSIADQREPGSILVPRLPAGYPFFPFTFQGLLFGEAYIAQDFLPLSII